MFLVLFNIYNVFTFAVGLPWRLIMKPFIKWWRKMVSNHLLRTVRNENIVFRADCPTGAIPYLYLRWTLNNGSEARIEIKRIYASLYLENRRIAHFDVCDPLIKNVGVGNRHQYLTVQTSNIQKGGKSEVEYYFYPSFEFWTNNSAHLSPSTPFLIEGAVEINGYGTRVSIRLVDSELHIIGIDNASSLYNKIMADRLQEYLKRN